MLLFLVVYKQYFFFSTEWPDAPGMWVREQVEGWKKVTDAVHREGGYIYSQVSYILFDRVKNIN